MKFLHKLDSFVERDEIIYYDIVPIVAFSCELGKFFITDEEYVIPGPGITLKKWKRQDGTDFFLVVNGDNPEVGGVALDVSNYPDEPPTQYEIPAVFPDENKAYKEPWVSLSKGQVQTQITDGSGNIYTYVGNGIYYGTRNDGIPSPID